MNTVVKFLPALYIIGGAIGVYLIIRALKFGGEKAGEALEAAQGSTTNALERLFPLTDSRSMTTHAVWFEDGKQHAVPGESVDSDGYFTYNGPPPMAKGTRYRLLQDASGRKSAARV